MGYPFIDDFASEREALSGRLAAFVSRLPAQLRDATVRYVRRVGLPPHELAWPSIYFLFPFWVQADLDKPLTYECFEVAYANGSLVYSVLLQDEAIDVLNDESAEKSMAANAFFLEACRVYSRLFATDTDFWRQAIVWLHDSWAAVAAESREHHRPTPGMLERDQSLQEAKSNPGKVAALAVCSLVGRVQDVAQLARYLNEWQAGCQLLDDLADVQEDLKAGNFTQLLVLAGAANREDGLRRAELFIGSGQLRGYLERVRTHYEGALHECPRSDGYLSQHVRGLLADLETRRATYERFMHLAGMD